MSKVGFKMIHGHNYATWELKIVKFSNFGQNHFSDFETPFLAGLILLEAKVHYKAYFTIDKPNKSIYLLGSLGPKCKD